MLLWWELAALSSFPKVLLAPRITAGVPAPLLLVPESPGTFLFVC